MTATGTRRGGLIYHWKHGWIPLDHFAALSKAKGNPDLAKKYAERHGLPATYKNRDEAEKALNRSLPKGYSAHYSPAPRGAIGATDGYRVTEPGGATASSKFASPAEVRSYVHMREKQRKAAPHRPEQVKPEPQKPAWSLDEANRQFRANQAAEDARTPRGSISDAQVALIQKLLIKKARSGTGGGFFNGPKTRKGILGLSRSEASAYINSLRGDY